MGDSIMIKPFYNYNDQIIIFNGDTLKVMAWLIKHGIRFDSIMADLPYGTTGLVWDFLIPMNGHMLIKGKPVYYEAYLLELIKNGASYPEALNQWKSGHTKGMWYYYKALIKKNGAIVLNASQPFTSYLVESNRKWFKYEWIWHKNRGSNFATVKYQPFKEHESILIFCEGSTATYNPQFIKIAESSLQRDKVGSTRDRSGKNTPSQIGNIIRQGGLITSTGFRNPSSVLQFNVPMGSESVDHPTQKPLKSIRYPIRVYTNPNDLILDNTAGSGTTAVAAVKEGRRCVIIEQSLEYCEVAKERVIEALMESGESGAAEGITTTKNYQIGFKF